MSAVQQKQLYSSIAEIVEKTLGDAVSGLPQDRVVLLNSLIDQNEIKDAVNKILDDNNIAHN